MEVDMRYSVDPDRVRAAGAEVGGAAGMLDRVQPSDCLAPLAGAFRGSLTSAELGALGRAWSDRVLSVRIGVRGLGHGLSAAAAAYEAVEAVVQRSVESVGSLAAGSGSESSGALGEAAR